MHKSDHYNHWDEKLSVKGRWVSYRDRGCFGAFGYKRDTHAYHGPIAVRYYLYPTYELIAGVMDFYLAFLAMWLETSRYRMVKPNAKRDYYTFVINGKDWVRGKTLFYMMAFRYLNVNPTLLNVFYAENKDEKDPDKLFLAFQAVHQKAMTGKIPNFTQYKSFDEGGLMSSYYGNCKFNVTIATIKKRFKAGINGVHSHFSANA